MTITTILKTGKQTNSLNVGPNTEKSIPVNPKIKPEHFLKDRNQLNFLIAHISHKEVLDIIHQQALKVFQLNFLYLI